MSVTTKIYHGSKPELVFPFAEFEDTTTVFFKRRYHIDQDYYEREKTRFGEEMDQSVLTGYRDAQSKRPWLLQSKSTPEPPNRLVVEELYGYVPSVVHRYPGSVNWTKPGVAVAGSSQIYWIGERSGSGIRLEDTPTFVEGSRGHIEVVMPQGNPPLPKTTVSPEVEITFINTAFRKIYFKAADPTEQGKLQELLAKTISFSYRGVSRVAFVLSAAAGSRSVESINAPCVFVRDYFRFNETALERVPETISPFRIYDILGNETNTLTGSTVPSSEEYKARIGEAVVADSSRIGKVAGDVWFRETPYVRLV